MKPLVDMYPPAMRAALVALHGPLQPMTPDEQAAFDSQRAAEMFKAEAKRLRPKQNDLLTGPTE